MIIKKGDNVNKDNPYIRKLEKGKMIPLIFDLAFKKVFGDINHKERLELLLSSILNEEVKVIDIMNNELIGDNKKDKRNAVDLVCKLKNEKYVNIEVNTSYGSYVKNRNILFLFRLASKQLKSGEKYKIGKTIQINLNTQNTNGRYYSKYMLSNVEDRKDILSNIIEIININVLHYTRMCYNKNVDELSKSDRVIGTIGINETDEFKRVSNGIDILEDMRDIMEKYSEEDDLLLVYDRDELLRNALQSDLEEGIKEAVEKAEVEITERVTKEVTKEVTNKVTKEVTKEVTDKVNKETTKDIARKMKKKGIDEFTISEITGMSLDEVKKI